jgi:hypothetical protein
MLTSFLCQQPSSRRRASLVLWARNQRRQSHCAGASFCICAESVVERLPRVECVADGANLGESLDERICARFLQWEVETAVEEDTRNSATVRRRSARFGGSFSRFLGATREGLEKLAQSVGPLQSSCRSDLRPRPCAERFFMRRAERTSAAMRMVPLRCRRPRRSGWRLGLNRLVRWLLSASP